MKVIYKITYPNGKIYIGKDSTGDNLRYFGSPNREYLENDFSWEQQKDITLRKELLFFDNEISETALIKKENELIEKYESNNPDKGYNLVPKYSKIN
ncbi:MAG: hypothetical protein LBK13_02185 [Spirochaetales bacterium]|jgi:hypothetical protein|nr:hypothetical protein [Spirochaetales bacterium]